MAIACLKYSFLLIIFKRKLLKFIAGISLVVSMLVMQIWSNAIISFVAFKRILN